MGELFLQVRYKLVHRTPMESLERGGKLQMTKEVYPATARLLRVALTIREVGLYNHIYKIQIA